MLRFVRKAALVAFALALFTPGEAQAITHTSMTGTVSVGVQIQPPTGPLGTTFTIRVGTGMAPHGFVYDIQMAQPGGSFQDWMTGTTQNSVPWTPSSSGTYKFRSRYRRLSNNGASLYSAA